MSRPGEWEICGHCRGAGKSSDYLGVIHPEDWEPEDLEDYVSGKYDRPCRKCSGTGKLWIDLGPCMRGETEDPCPCQECERERLSWASLAAYLLSLCT